MSRSKRVASYPRDLIELVMSFEGETEAAIIECKDEKEMLAKRLTFYGLKGAVREEEKMLTEEFGKPGMHPLHVIEFIGARAGEDNALVLYRTGQSRFADVTKVRVIKADKPITYDDPSPASPVATAIPVEPKVVCQHEPDMYGICCVKCGYNLE